MSDGLLASAGLLYIAGVVGLTSVLVGRGLGRKQLWTGWAVVWVLTTTLVLLANRGVVRMVDPVAAGLVVAATVGIPTGIAVRYVDRRTSAAGSRRWWIDALFAGVVFLVTLVFTPVAVVAIGWVRLGLGE
jgi:hypothetical protein